LPVRKVGNDYRAKKLLGSLINEVSKNMGRPGADKKQLFRECLFEKSRIFSQAERVEDEIGCVCPITVKEMR
jgi:hypothetical protein